MIKVFIGLGFLMFFSGAALIAVDSENIGLTLSIFGFLILGLFMGLAAWFSEQEPYIKWHKLMAIFWLCMLLYYLPDFLLAPGLLSPWFVYFPYIILIVAYLYERRSRHQGNNHIEI